MKRYAALLLHWLFIVFIALSSHTQIKGEETKTEEIEIDLSTLDTAATYNEAYSDFDDFAFVEEYLTDEATAHNTAIPEVPEPTPDIPVIEFDLPIFGNVGFYLAFDPITNKSFYKARLVEGKKLYLGRLILESPVLEIIKGNLSITCRTRLFDKSAKVGLINLVLDKKDKKKIKTIEFGVIFDDPSSRPTLELFPGQQIVILKQRLVFEQDKPAVLIVNLDIYGKPTNAGIIFTGSSVGAFMSIEKIALLQFVADVAGTPLSDAVIKEAKIEIENLIVNGTAPKKDKYDLLAEEKEHLLTLDMHGILDIPEIKETLLTKQKAQAAGDLAFHAVINKKGITLDASSNNFPIQDIGMIEDAKIHLRTQPKKEDEEEAVASIKEEKKEDAGLKVSGTLSLEVAQVGTLNIETAIVIQKDKVVFSGTLKDTFTYNNFVLNPGIGVNYNSTKKSFGLSTRMDFEGLALKVSFTFSPNKKDPTKKDIVLSATAEATTFEPFKYSGIPSLEDVYATDLNVGFDVQKAADGNIINIIKLSGILHLLGKNFKSEIRAVNDEKGHKGIYIQAPLQENVTLGDILLGFNQPPLNSITFKKVEFLASSISFVDPSTKATISKGLSMVAQVPLTGALEKVGSYLGTSGQELTVQGAILPNDPKKSSFSAILSRGISDPTKVVSMGATALIIKGEPAVGIKASMTFRPEPAKRPEQVMEFAGEMSLATKELEFIMQMDGMWEEPFGFKNMAVGNLIAQVGMMHGSPGTPTKVGFRGRLDYNQETVFDLTMMVDAGLKDCGMKGTFKKIISLPELVLMFLTDQGLDLGPLNIPLFQLQDTQVAIAPKDILVGVSGKEELIKQGIEINSKMIVLGKKGQLGILIRAPTLSGDNFGLKALGTLEQINIADLLIVTGKGGVGDPIVDVELTLLRQKFLISGRINLANLYHKEAFLEITNHSIEFNFEEALGGDKFNVNGEPLLLSQVHGIATSLDQNFVIDIAFKEYLQKYLEDQINKQFNAAKIEVEKQINSAKKDVASVRVYAQEVEQQIAEAREAVTAAKKEVDTINESIKQAQHNVDLAQEEVNILKRKIKTQRNRIDRSPNSVDTSQHVAELATYTAAYEIATAALDAARAVATGTLVASRETAQATLTLAQQFLDTIVKNSSNAIFYGAAGTADAVLDGFHGISYLVLSGSEYVISLPLGFVEVNEISYHGELKTLQQGKLGNVKIKASIAGAKMETTITIDAKKGFDALTESLNAAAARFTEALNTKVLTPIKRAAASIENTLAPTKKVKKMTFQKEIPIEVLKRMQEAQKKPRQI